MSKEAIELLDAGINDLCTVIPKCRDATGIDKILQALALLRAEEPKCKTCGDTGKPKQDEWCEFYDRYQDKGVCKVDYARGRKCDLQHCWLHRKYKVSKNLKPEITPCPDCKPEEPPQGEFTKQLRHLCTTYLLREPTGSEKVIAKDSIKACDIIDRQEIDLLEAKAAIVQLENDACVMRGEISRQVAHIKLLQECDDSSTKVIGEQADERDLILQENMRLSQQAKEYFSEAAQAKETIQSLRKDIVSQAAELKELKEKQDAEQSPRGPLPRLASGDAGAGD